MHLTNEFLENRNLIPATISAVLEFILCNLSFIAYLCMIVA